MGKIQEALDKVKVEEADKKINELISKFEDDFANFVESIVTHLDDEGVERSITAKIDRMLNSSDIFKILKKVKVSY